MRLFSLLASFGLALCQSLFADSNTNAVMGSLGHPLGTELTIEGTVPAGLMLGHYREVAKVNGKAIAQPRTVRFLVSGLPINQIL